MTYVEEQVWSQLRRKQLGVRFLLQYSIDQYIIDFYSPEIKLAVEIDGGIHEQMRSIKKKDKKRQNYIESFGIHFIRIMNDEYLGNPNEAINRIEEEVQILKNL